MDDHFSFLADPDNPGWYLRATGPVDRFIDIFGGISARVEGPAVARVRVMIEPRHRNIVEHAHGGFLLALVDQSYFIASAMLGVAGALGGVTIDSACQFLAPALVGKPVDAVVEVLRETGRMVFMRGLIEQDDTRVLAFSGTIRKASRP